MDDDITDAMTALVRAVKRLGFEKADEALAVAAIGDDNEGLPDWSEDLVNRTREGIRAVQARRRGALVVAIHDPDGSSAIHEIGPGLGREARIALQRRIHAAVADECDADRQALGRTTRLDGELQ